MKKKMKKRTQIHYDVLKKDFLYVNLSLGAIGLSMFLYMLLQKAGILPEMRCYIHDWLHIYCVGCGGTRAIFALLQGDILLSLYYNPAIVLGGILIVYYELGFIITLIKKNGKRYYCTSLIPVVLFLVVVLAFSVVRNYLLFVYQVDMLRDFIPT